MSRDGTSGATALAPGFRFHPTDEELVRYYLKRKVAGRRLRVDAISELDLYKSEPWDLPGRSRIRSRDMEWYFFSPLDKKYASRSRTSRTTGKGYWKTTGKDRAVRRGARVLGMKKTLVFHIGKAPKGKRTNWVMHEYRLEDEDLVKAGVSQVEYVVCRIFQKNGAGPQGGDLYGASFVEEEWEEDDDASGKGDAAQGMTNNFRDSEHERKVVDILEDNITTLADSNDGKNACMNVVDNEGSSTSFTQRDNTLDFINFDHEVSMPDSFVDPDVAGPGDANLPEIHQNHELQGDGYLELNDFADILDGDLFCTKDSLTWDVTEQTTQNSTGLLQELMIKNSNVDFPEPVQMQIPPSVAEVSDIQSEENFYPVIDDYSSYREADNHMIYVDAPEVPVHGSSTEMNEFIYPPFSIPSKPDPVDELITYFDATEDDLLNCNLENVNSINSSEVNKDGMQLQEISHSRPDTNAAEEVDFSCSKTIETRVMPDDHSDDGWATTFKKHLVGVLGSISSPPAFAAEYPIKAAKSLDLSSGMLLPGSVRISATAIHVEVSSRAKHRPVQKNEELDWCGYRRDDAIFSDLETVVSVGRVRGGLASLVRGRFCPFSLSFVLLAVCYKMGVCLFAVGR